jgi:hypothetical protein
LREIARRRPCRQWLAQDLALLQINAAKTVAVILREFPVWRGR